MLSTQLVSPGGEAVQGGRLDGGKAVQAGEDVTHPAGDQGGPGENYLIYLQELKYLQNTLSNRSYVNWPVTLILVDPPRIVLRYMEK